MNLTELLSILEVDYQHCLVSSKHAGDLLSYVFDEHITVSVNGHDVSDVRRLCFVNKDDGLFVYLNHGGLFDYCKLLLSEVVSFVIVGGA